MAAWIPNAVGRGGVERHRDVRTQRRRIRRAPQGGALFHSVFDAVNTREERGAPVLRQRHV
jgi:hypothetical protein